MDAVPEPDALARCPAGGESMGGEPEALPLTRTWAGGEQEVAIV